MQRVQRCVTVQQQRVPLPVHLHAIEELEELAADNVQSSEEEQRHGCPVDEPRQPLEVSKVPAFLLPGHKAVPEARLFHMMHTHTCMLVSVAKVSGCVWWSQAVDVDVRVAVCDCMIRMTVCDCV